jgi:hypothetical protein
MNANKTLMLSTTIALAMAGAVAAQVNVDLPDSGQSTTLTANVSEQANVTVPAGVTFDVTDVTSNTLASDASVSISNIVLSSATRKLKVSVQAAAANFTPPVALATTWGAGDISWNAASWTRATGASGTLSSGSFGEVTTCDADVADCSTTALQFTLAAKGSVKRSGNHTLDINWKFEGTGL